MHLSYIIAVVASVSATVSAISDSQQLEPPFVVTTNAAQSESVVTTPSDPGSSKRSLRVQELEDKEENGDATTDGDDYEQRMSGNFFSSVGVKIKTGLGFGATVSSPAQTALQKQPELLAKANTLKMKTGAQVESLSMQYAANVAPAMKKADPKRFKTDKYLEELFQGSKAAKGLKGQTSEAILRERLLAPYRKLLDDKDMTADKFRATITHGSPTMTDEAVGAIDIIYSTLVIDRLRKTMSHYSVDQKVNTQSKEAWWAIEGNPVALTHFGRLMDDPTKLNDVVHELGKVKGGDDAAHLILKAFSFFEVYKLKKLEHLKLVEDIAENRKATVSDWVYEKTKQFDQEPLNLQKLKAEANIDIFRTKRDDIKYDMLNGVIASRLSKGMNDASFNQQTEIIEVINLLEKNKLAQKFLPEAVGGKNKEQLDKLLHVGAPNLDAAKRAEVEEASKLLGRIHDLSEEMKLFV
uniref:RxLR effector candidate protein n=1 Tax=Hyaloperonospora arabidopsidis (strain Emoy2) TaxID=559515 RepID=M4BG46_HYAAE|nr:RxLR effector candidate protein [Hyaloperonospora arabidopsidis Emoy2]